MQGNRLSRQTGIFEVLDITDKIRAAIEEKATPVKLRQMKAGGDDDVEEMR